VCSDCNSKNYVAVWSPDGTSLLVGRHDTLVKHALDRSAPDQALVQEEGRMLVPSDWLPDGRIIYQSRRAGGTSEIKLLEQGAQTGRVVVPLGIGSNPTVSPDRRWLAYVSSQTGASEVVVQAFPGPGPQAQFSAGGGSNPTWSADSRTLYYLRQTEVRGSAVVAVPIAASSGLTAGKGHELFRRPDSQRCAGSRCYDISADGPRFLMFDKPTMPRASVTRMDLVLNWAASLSKGR
jgi:hypothetical protein